jgi:hypothetical protein
MAMSGPRRGTQFFHCNQPRQGQWQLISATGVSASPCYLWISLANAIFVARASHELDRKSDRVTLLTEIEKFLSERYRARRRRGVKERRWSCRARTAPVNSVGQNAAMNPSVAVY